MTSDDLVSLERIGDQLARIADALDSLATQHGAPKPIPPGLLAPRCPAEYAVTSHNKVVRCHGTLGHPGSHQAEGPLRVWRT